MVQVYVKVEAEREGQVVASTEYEPFEFEDAAFNDVSADRRVLIGASIEDSQQLSQRLADYGVTRDNWISQSLDWRADGSVTVVVTVRGEVSIPDGEDSEEEVLLLSVSLTNSAGEVVSTLDALVCTSFAPDGSQTGHDIFTDSELVDSVYSNLGINLSLDPPAGDDGMTYAVQLRTPAGVVVDLNAPLPIVYEDHPDADLAVYLTPLGATASATAQSNSDGSQSVDLWALMAPAAVSEWQANQVRQKASTLVDGVASGTATIDAAWQQLTEVDAELCIFCQASVYSSAFDGQTKVVQTLCQHLFHADCLISWLNATDTNDWGQAVPKPAPLCPSCRADLRQDASPTDPAQRRTRAATSTADVTASLCTVLIEAYTELTQATANAAAPAPPQPDDPPDSTDNQELDSAPDPDPGRGGSKRPRDNADDSDQPPPKQARTQ